MFNYINHMYWSLFKYQNEYSQNNIDLIHLFYSSELSNHNLLDYTVMLIEGDEFKCIFNWRHFDEELYKMLAPVMRQDTQYYFANINELKDKPQYPGRKLNISKRKYN